MIQETEKMRMGVSSRYRDILIKVVNRSNLLILSVLCIIQRIPHQVWGGNPRHSAFLTDPRVQRKQKSPHWRGYIVFFIFRKFLGMRKLKDNKIKVQRDDICKKNAN